jgi:hypothetical protein
MLHLNQEQFDFNLQFESLFFAIIPSVLFIPSSLWRTLAQIRKPVVVNAPVLQFIKTVYTPSSITRFLPTDCLGCHRYLRWLGTCPPYASRDWVLPH